MRPPSIKAVIVFTVVGAHRGKITVSAERRANVKGGDVRFTSKSRRFEPTPWMSANDPKRTFVGLCISAGVYGKEVINVPLSRSAVPLTAIP